MSKIDTLKAAAQTTLDNLLAEVSEALEEERGHRMMAEEALAIVQPTCRQCGADLLSRPALEAAKRLTGVELGTMEQRLQWSLRFCDEECNRLHTTTAERVRLGTLHLLRGEFAGASK